MKWNPKRKAKFHNAFVETYQPVVTEILHPDNFDRFLGVE